MESTQQIYAGEEKRVDYLSMEFLIGRLLIDSLTNLGLCEAVLGAVEQANLPGTTDTHPNWRRKISLPIEELVTASSLLVRFLTK